MDREKAKVICITPTKNEEWVIDRFIRATSLWADEIIIADQMSTDKTREIVTRYDKVKLIDNNSEKFNENERQKLLINEARKIQGKKLLVALDADEFLTGDFIESEEWNEVICADTGTVVRMDWPCISSDFCHYWVADGSSNVFAYMDDGAPHTGSPMHSIRLPEPENAPMMHLSGIKVMHFQYTDWARMKSKNLWYQCYERIKNPQKSVFEIYRMYHHMDVHGRMRKIPADWFEGYDHEGIDLRQKPDDIEKYWWDDEVEQFIDQYGAEYFKYIDISTNNNRVLSYLRKTQFLWRYRYGRALLRRVDRIVASRTAQ